MNCFMDNRPAKVLWDSGAQSSIVNENWRQNHLPHTVVRPISELLDNETLTVFAANDTPIPYIGWIEVSFRLGSDLSPTSELQVPILVSSDPAVASDPIIGYNVIEAIVNQEEVKTKGGRKQLAHYVSKAFEITVRTAHNVIKLVQNSSEGPETGVVRTGARRVPLSANQVTTVYVRAHVSSHARGQDMLFLPDGADPPPEGVIVNDVLVKIPDRKVPYVPIPVTNTTDHTIYLDSRKVIGYLEPVKTVYAAGIQTKVNELTQENKSGTELKSHNPSNTQTRENQQRPKSWDPPVDLQHLDENQRAAARKMLQEESHLDYDDYVSCWKKRMQEAYTVASQTATKEAARGKAYYDKKVKGRDLQPGDRVLLRNLTPRGGPAKIQSFWENQVYKVKERKADDSPVYVVCPENGQGRDKVVHRNLLLPCDFLPLEKPSTQTVQPPKDSPTVTRKKFRPPRRQQQPGNGDTSDDDDSGTFQWYLRRQRQTPLNPLAESFQPHLSLHCQEEDLPLQSEEDLPLQSEETVPGQIQGPDPDNDRPLSGDAMTDILAATGGETDSARQRPQRQRQQPTVLSYDTLGQPTLVQRNCSVTTAQVIDCNGFWRPWAVGVY
ncbi:unnamed protein product [Oreochromis niloticus]|nr:unnamed protein product [Mustela putorius furo]